MTIANQFAPVWNASGVNYNAIRADVTDIASSGGSTLLDLRVNNSGVFSVNKAGTIAASGSLFVAGSGVFSNSVSGSSATFNNISLANNRLNIVTLGAQDVAIRANTVSSTEPYFTGYPWHFAWVDDIPKITIQCSNPPLGVKVSSDSFFAFANSTNSRVGSVDLSLFRDASNTLAQRNSTNAQTFRLYGTYTDASNYRRLYLSSTTAGAFTLGVEGAGTGASGNTLTVAHATTFSGTVNFIGGDWNTPSFYLGSSIRLYGPSALVTTILGEECSALDQSNFKFRMQISLGWSSTNSANGSADVWLRRNSSGPSLQVQAAGGIKIRNTNDSADAPITASNGTFSGHLSATTKSFLIDHPTKPGRKLQYGSLESPYHGIRLTGRSFVEGGIGVIELPDYVRAFVSDDVNIQLTPVGRNILWVDCIDLNNNQVIVGADSDGDFYWSFTGIRTDVELEVEPWA